MKWIIEDWAGNHCFAHKRFNTFEDGWDFLYEFYAHLDEKDFSDQMGEYYVLNKKPKVPRMLHL